MENEPQIDVALEKSIENDILIEILRATKLPDWGFVRQAVSATLRKSIVHFSTLIAELDAIIGQDGFAAAARYGLSELTHEAVSLGGENIPSSGPLVIASNHPGTYDAFAIISQMPRNDIKLIVSSIPFFRDLPHASRQLIFATHNTNERTNVIRQSIRHLQEGGALLIFPSGRIDPDPSVLPGALDGLQRWSRSIEVFLRKVPESQLVLTITSGVLSGKFINHFIPRLFKNDHERRRMMEFMQVISQTVQLKPLDLNPKVSFASPLAASAILPDLEAGGETAIRQKAVQLLDYHMAQFYPGKQTEAVYTP